MLIRKASPSDAKEIRKITLTLNINRDSKEKTGFVEFKVPTEKDYIKRILKNDFFYVTEENNKIIGFISGYSDYFLSELKIRDEIIDFIEERKIKPYIYCEQLAVIDEYTNKGLGTRLQKILIEDAKKNKYKVMFGAVSHFPFKNKIIIDLIKQLGFILIDEITIQERLIFGIYEKEL